jgi:hypothetical protein
MKALQPLLGNKRTTTTAVPILIALGPCEIFLLLLPVKTEEDEFVDSLAEGVCHTNIDCNDSFEDTASLTQEFW